MEDEIIIDIEISVKDLIDAASSFTTRYKFPGVDKFKEDVIRILEDEFGFVIIKERYRGKPSKGRISNRKNSVSLYFNTLYDLSNNSTVLSAAKQLNATLPIESAVNCFVHFRFSDHALHDASDAKHLNYLKRNREAATEGRNDIVRYIDEESILVRPKLLANYYDKALNKLRLRLSSRIDEWVDEYLDDLNLTEDNE